MMATMNPKKVIMCWTTKNSYEKFRIGAIVLIFIQIKIAKTAQPVEMHESVEYSKGPRSYAFQETCKKTMWRVTRSNSTLPTHL
jgi:hypothetical protein